MILKIVLHDRLGFSNIIVPSQSSVLSSWIIRKRSGQGIVRENKSRALSIAHYGAANQRGLVGAGGGARREANEAVIKKSSTMWNSSLRTASGTNTDVQRRALYLRAFKFWPIRIHFERGQAVIYACGTCGSRSRRGNNSRARGQEERSGSSGVTKRGIERRARERKRERGGREREREKEKYALQYNKIVRQSLIIRQN